MVRVGLRKENVKSVIMTSDKEFKRKAITFLNGSAIAAEKIVVEHMQGALLHFDQDEFCGNFVLDATTMKAAELKVSLELFAAHKSSGDSRILIFLDEGQSLQVRDAIQTLIPLAQIYFMPMAQAQFNKTFHGTRAALQAPKESEGKKPATPAADAHASTQTAEQKGSITLLETSAHLKETVELLNTVAKDKNRTDLVRSVGQRFNGLIGAFAFLKATKGFAEMQNLARIVDDVARTYESPASPVITDKHWQLMMESAKTLYLILRELRESHPIPETLLGKAAQLEKLYQAADNLSRRQSQSQDDIDQLIENELLKKLG